MRGVGCAGVAEEPGHGGWWGGGVVDLVRVRRVIQAAVGGGLVGVVDLVLVRRVIQIVVQRFVLFWNRRSWIIQLFYSLCTSTASCGLDGILINASTG